MANIANVIAGQEAFKQCKLMGRSVVQYDFRDHDGELFSCVAPTVETARTRRDKWLAARH